MKKIEKEETGRKSKETVILKDSLNDILMNLDMSFTNEGVNIIKNLLQMKEWLTAIIDFFKQVILSFKTLNFKKDLVHCMTYCLTYFLKKQALLKK